MMKLRKIEWILLASLIVLCLISCLFFYLPKEGNTIAVISVDAKEYMHLDLEHEENRVFSIEQKTGKPVSFEIKDGAIRFVQVDCPDHLCEQMGWCSAPGQRAVCLPNRITLICYAYGEI